MKTEPEIITWAENEHPPYLGVWRSGGDSSGFDRLFSQYNGGKRQFWQRELAAGRISIPTGTVAYHWLMQGSPQVTWPGGEPLALGPGDVVALSGGQSYELSGSGVFNGLEVMTTAAIPFTGVSRIVDLEDTSGGCNPAENAFRRLQIVWESARKAEGGPDGRNIAGCHVVWIAANSSRTHYHPVPPVPGGEPQHEMYLVLDPAEYGLRGDEGTPGLWTYATKGDWSTADFTPLKHGDVVYIPPGVPHRAIDILACVIAIPGFKPGNELFLDPEIARDSKGLAPHNVGFRRE